MCRAKSDPNYRRCKGLTRWCVNREGHERFAPDAEQERHWHKPIALCSMTPGAIRVHRMRANDYAAEVDAVRTIHGIDPDEAIGPVLREELWGHRSIGAGLSLLTLADRLRAIAAEEGVPVEQIAERYQRQQITPHRMRAGERLAALVVDPTRPDWVDEQHLVQMVEPLDNGTPSKAYVRVVRDADGAEWTLVTSYDGSEPEAFGADQAGLKAAMYEALQRMRAINDDEAVAHDYEQWLTGVGAASGSLTNPWTQSMTDDDFLALTGDGGMHLV